MSGRAKAPTGAHEISGWEQNLRNSPARCNSQYWRQSKQGKAAALFSICMNRVWAHTSLGQSAAHIGMTKSQDRAQAKPGWTATPTNLHEDSQLPGSQGDPGLDRVLYPLELGLQVGCAELSCSSCW